MNPTIRQAIARIDVLQDDKSLSRGTGTLVTSDLVLTAMHVVADRKSPTLSLYPGAITLSFPGHVTEAQVVDRGWNPNADWILLRCVTPPPFAPLPLADSVVDGDRWETYGFPDANPRDGMVQIGTIDNAAGSFEGVSAFQLFSNQAAAGMGAPVKGLSGGPVVVDGALVAVMRSSLMREGQNVAGTLYGCSVDLILQATGDLLPVPDPCRGLPGLPRLPLPATPFRYLDRFSAPDAEIFFGRNREIRQMRDLVIADDGPPVVLLYGQSGAGKSSFLDAGLLPRLAATHAVSYLRRDRDKGLLATLLDGVRAQLPSRGAAPSAGDAESLRLAWLEAESASAKPLVVILDQIEEVITLPAAADELSSFVAAVAGTFQAPAHPRGRLVLGFRKEWFAELQQQLEEHGVEFAKMFLDTLDASAIVEVVTGLRKTQRLRDRYGLDLEAGLAGKIARDLTVDPDSPVAPTLQVLLSKMWHEAKEVNGHAPRFSEELYVRLNKDGLLGDFLDEQINVLRQRAAAAGGSHADAVTSGLVADVITFHTTSSGSAQERTAAELRQEYGHRPDDAAWVVQELKRLYLLTDPVGDAESTRTSARLSQNTLAPLVRARFEISARPGQRARRILENRAAEWSHDQTGLPLDARDLELVEHGLSGMRRLRPDEERLVTASREEVRRLRRVGIYRRTAAIAAVVAIVLAAAVAVWLRILERRQVAWTDLFALDAQVPVLLDIEPVNGLIAAVHAINQNLTLNNGRLLPGTRGNLVRALGSARERTGWRLEVPATAIAVSADDRIAVGTNDGMVRVFRFDGIDDIPPIRGAGGGTVVRAVAFSADGTFLAAAMDAQGLGVWKRDETQPQQKGFQPLASTRTPDLPLGKATAVQFSPDGHTLIATFTAGNVHTLYVCNLDEGRATATPMAVRDSVSAIATARAGGGQLVIATAGGDLRIWSETGALQWQPDADLDGSITSVDLALVHDPKPRVLVAAARNDGTVSVWAAPARRAYHSYRVAPGKVVVAFGLDGRLLHAGSVDGIVYSYDLARDREAIEPIATAGEPQAVTTSSNGKRIVTVAVRSDKAFIQVFDLNGSQLVFPLRAPAFPGQEDSAVHINAVAFAGPDTLIAGALGRAIPRWRVKVKQFEPWLEDDVSPIDSGQDETTAVASDASGRVVVLAGREKILFLVSGVRVEGRENLPAEASDIALSPDGSVAVVASNNGMLTLWDTTSGRLKIKPIQAHAGEGGTVAFNAAGTVFVSGGADSVIHFWNADGTPRGRVERKGIDSTALAFHRDGTVFSGDSTGRVAHLEESGRSLASTQLFRGDSVNQIVVSPTGDTVFVAGPPGIRVIDAGSGSILNLRFPRVNESILTLALNSTGTLLAAATAAGEVMLWRADWQSWLAEACNRLKDHAVFRSLSGPVPGAININTHGVNYQAAYQTCETRVSAPVAQP